MRSPIRGALSQTPLLLILLAGAVGCEALRREEPAVPTEQQAAEFFGNAEAVDSIALSGNVVELYVPQEEGQLRRGGSLWARVGPYIYLFSPATRELMEAYPGLAAVRVVTLAGEQEVARATLLRDSMNATRWRRSLNLLGYALQEGTERPSRLEELVQWGEAHAEFRYNPDFVPQ